MSLIVDIEKRLGAFTLRAELEARGGEALALLGPSGCGKTVTLKCVAGILTPDRGHIELDGRVLYDSKDQIDLPPQERQIGYLFQQYALFPNMTVEQNILCGIQRGGKAEKAELAAAQIRRFRLGGLEKQYPAQLSGGQQQRVALARILASGPQAVLLDEPFSALDSFLKWNLELELGEMLSGFPGPLLWVSHDVGECRRNCRKVCVMESGNTDPVIPIEELFTRPASRSAARLAGCKNFLRAERAAEGLRLPEWDVTLPLQPEQSGFDTMAVFNAAILPDGGELSLRVCRVIEDVDGYILLLRPEDAAPSAPFLRFESPVPHAVGETLGLGFRTDKLFFF